MAASRKSILIVALGRNNPLPAAFGDPKTIQAQVAASTAEAEQAGYDITNFAVDLQDLNGTLKTIRQKLNGQHWDGMLIGFGVRGDKNHTVLFESVVNASREVSPGTKLLFSPGPYDLMTTLERNFLE